MKKYLNCLIALLLAFILVLGVALMNTDQRLKASEDDGSVSASEQQKEKKEEKKSVSVDVPKKEEPKEEKKEEPKEEKKPEPKEEKKEEPKEEKQAEPEKKEEPKEEKQAEPEKKEEPKAEEPKEESKPETPAEEKPAASDETPAEKEGSEVTAEPEAAKEKKAAPRVKITIENDGNIHFGDKVKMNAKVTGIEGDYKLQWQYNGGSGWKDISGAHSKTYSFVINETNYDYDYRVVIDY